MLSGKCNSRLWPHLQRVNNITVNEISVFKATLQLTFEFVKHWFLFCLLFELFNGKAHAAVVDSSQWLNPDSAQATRTAQGIVINNPHLHPWCLRTTPISSYPAIPRPNNNRTAPFAVAFLLLSLMAFMRQVFPRYIDSLTSFIRPGNRTAQHDRMPLQTDEKAVALFNIFYYVGLGTLLYFTLNTYTHWGNGQSPLLFWGQVCGALLLYYSLRYIFTTWVANTFSQSDNLERYRFMTRVVNQTVALFLLPCIIILIMTRQSPIHPAIIGISLSLVLVGYAIRTLKSRDWVVKLLHIDGLHFLLYLCAFELVPVLVFLKLINGTT